MTTRTPKSRQVLPPPTLPLVLRLVSLNSRPISLFVDAPLERAQRTVCAVVPLPHSLGPYNELRPATQVLGPGRTERIWTAYIAVGRQLDMTMQDNTCHNSERSRRGAGKGTGETSKRAHGGEGG